MSTTLLHVARAARAVGSCPIPAAPGKRPHASWKHWQHELPDDAQLVAWFWNEHHEGIGLVTGQGDLEMFELEGRAVADGLHLRFVERADALGLGELVRRIGFGYMERTPTSGMHFLYRCPGAVTGNLKLATSADKQVLIETRGQGGFTVINPSNGSTHPSGLASVKMHGGFDTIAVITPEEREQLHALASSFDESAVVEFATPSTPSTSDGLRPGDDFNQRADWMDDMLAPHDWEIMAEHGGIIYVKRAGSTSRWSATINAPRCPDKLYVFTTSTDLTADRAYDKFGAYAALNHGGVFAAAAQALAEHGYGEPTQSIDHSVWIPGKSTGSNAAGDVTAASKQTNKSRPTRRLTVVDLQTVVAKDVDWLWQDRIPRGMVTLLVGDPGDGKSYVTMSLASMLSRGECLPAMEQAAVSPSDVIMANYEDPAEETMRPRADRAGGFGTGRILLIEDVTDDGEPRPFGPSDVDLLEAELIKHPNVVMVVIDPIGSYLPGKVDTGRDNQVRGVLTPLTNLARRRGVAVVGVMHLNKTEAEHIIYRVSGSVAGFVGLARSVLLVGKDPESGRRAVVQIKSNVGPQAAPVEFQITGTGIEWKGIAEDLTADRLLASPAKPSKRDEAADWLRNYMDGKPCRSTVVLDAADKAVLDAAVDASGQWGHCGAVSALSGVGAGR